MPSTIKGRQKSIFQNFGNTPVVDGDDPLRLHPKEEDALGAVCKSPTECVLARCARRMYGSTAVVFLKTSCYVDMLDEDGIRRVHRWPVPARVRKQLERFDRGEPFKLGASIILPVATEKTSMQGNRDRSAAVRGTVRGRTIHQLGQLKHLSRVQQEKVIGLRARVKTTIDETNPKHPKVVHVKALLKSAEVDATKAAAKVTAGFKRVREIDPDYDLSVYAARKSRVFDLSTRNGVGHYNFVRG